MCRVLSGIQELQGEMAGIEKEGYERNACRDSTETGLMIEYNYILRGIYSDSNSLEMGDSLPSLISSKMVAYKRPYTARFNSAIGIILDIKS